MSRTRPGHVLDTSWTLLHIMVSISGHGHQVTGHVECCRTGALESIQMLLRALFVCIHASFRQFDGVG